MCRTEAGEREKRREEDDERSSRLFSLTTVQPFSFSLSLMEYTVGASAEKIGEKLSIRNTFLWQASCILLGSVMLIAFSVVVN